MVRVKAASCIHTLEMTKETFGQDVLERMKPHLPAASRALLERRLSPVEWLAVSEWQPVNEAILDHLCAGDEQRYIGFFRRVCERDFSTLYKTFLKVLSPTYVLDRTAKLWSTYNDGGTLTLVRLAEHGGRQQLRLELRGYDHFPKFRLVLQAFIEQLLTMTGAKDVDVRLGAPAAGAKTLDCDFFVSFAA